MKTGKFLLICLVLVLITGFMPVSSFAFFEEGNLILSVYNETDMDLGIDLGVASVIISNTTTNVVLAPIGTISLDKFGDNVEGWGDLSAGAWGGVRNLYQIYEGMTDTLAPAVPMSQISKFFSARADVSATGYGDSNNGEQYAVISSSDRNSYDLKMNSNSNAPGNFGGINPYGSTNKSEANLGLLDTAGYVDLNLYAYDAMTNMAGLSGGAAPNAVIRIMADGSVILNPYVPPQDNTITITASASPAALDEGSGLVQLTGSATDTLGDTLSYSWAQTDGPAVTLSGAADAPTRSFSSPNVGYGGATLVFQLTVSDQHSNTALSDSVTVTVNFVNQAPVANAGPDLHLDRDTSPSTITLQGSAHDPDAGDTVTIAWTQVSGNPVTLSNSNTATPSFSLAEVNGSDSSLEFQISVTDRDGRVSTDSMTVYVTSPPTARAQASQTDVNEVHGSTVSVTLIGSNSTDPDNDIISYNWNYTGSLSVVVTNDDTAQSDRDIQIPEVGYGGAQLEFILTVTDSNGNTDSDTVTVTVNNVNRDPEPVIVSPGTVSEGSEFTLDATGSSDPDGPTDTELTSIVWTQLNDSFETHAELVDNSSALAPRFRAPGLDYGESLTLEFELSVTDQSGSTKTATVSVPVAYVNHAPQAVITCEGLLSCPERYLSGETLSLSSATSIDEDGADDIVSRQWTLTLKPSGSTADVNAATESITMTIPETAGSYRITLTLTDRSGASHTATYNFRVENENAHAPIPTISADDQVFEGMILSLDGSASTDPEGAEDIVSRDWSFEQITHTDKPISIVFENNGSYTPSFTSPHVDEDTQVDIILTLTDTSGLSASVSHRITILNNHVPTAPSINAPRYTGGVYSSDNGEVNTLTPTLSVNNASDGDGHALTYHFQLFTNSSMTTILAEKTGINPGGAVTSWTIAAEDFLVSGDSLNDETVYYFRASATDGLSFDNEILWSQTASFFVNLANDAPTLPSVIYPRDHAVIRTLNPWFRLGNATDQDLDTLVYEFRIYSYENGFQGDLLVSTGDQPIAQGNIAVDDDGNPLSTPSQGETSWKPAVTLTDNSTYLWKVRATDINPGEVSVERNWKTLIFTVNTEDDTPSSPVVDTPVNNAEVEILNPKLTVINAVDNDPDDILTYYFEVIKKGDDSCEERFSACEAGGCTIVQSGAVNEGSMDNELPGGSVFFGGDNFFKNDSELPLSDTSTSWTIPLNGPGLPLSDNSYYCWRVQVSDSSDQASEWSYSRFFVNRENDVPEAPLILSPQNGSTMTNSSDPASTITLSIINALDADQDNLTYRFELFDHHDPETDVPLYTKTTNELKWQIPKQALTSGQTYYWRVRASDSETDGPWSVLYSFRYFEEYPPAPTINSPAHFNVVNSLNPTLTVLNPESIEADNITYEFELYASNKFAGTSWVASASISQGDLVTQWKLSSKETRWSSSYPDHKLLNKTNYYWRVRATDESSYSSWTNTSRFSVNVDAQVFDVTVAASQSVLASSATDQVILVNDAADPLNGISLTIPSGELNEDTTVTIGYVTNANVLPSNLVSLYSIMEFSPTGLTFPNGIKLTLPWNMNGLPSGVLESATAVGLYYYNTDSSSWDLVQEIPISSITGDTLSFTLGHFSSYAVGVNVSGVESSDDTPDPGSTSDDSSNFGCFIGSSFM